MFGRLFRPNILKGLAIGCSLLANTIYQSHLQKQKPVECCGIIGFIGKKKEASNVILNGVELL